MASLRASEAGLNWRAAALLGLISSTFSTLMSQLVSARIGRDAAVDWMVVAAIPLRDPILQSDPTWTGIIGGILFHQWAASPGRWCSSACLGPGQPTWDLR